MFRGVFISRRTLIQVRSIFLYHFVIALSFCLCSINIYAQQFQWNYSGTTTPCLPANATWEGRVGIGFNNPQSLLHVHSMYCPSNGSVTQAIERLQTYALEDAFGLSSFQFWSNSVASGQDWMVGAIEPITKGLAPFNGTNTGNWFGGLAFYCSGSNQRPLANDKIEVMRLYDRRVAINSSTALGVLDIVTTPLDPFKNRIVFDNGKECLTSGTNNYGPIMKFYRPTGSQPGIEFANSMTAWVNLETGTPVELGLSRFNIYLNSQSAVAGQETESQMHRRLSITGNGNVGIGQIMPDAKLQVTNGALLIDGTVGGVPQKWTFTPSPDTSDPNCLGTWTRSELGQGTRLMWIPNKGAFRAGTAHSTDWDTPNIGAHSIAMGNKTRAIGDHSIAIGDGCQAESFKAVSIGEYNYTENTYYRSTPYIYNEGNNGGTTTIGMLNTNLGTYGSAIFGANNTIAKGLLLSCAIGCGNRILNYSEYNSLPGEDQTSSYAFGGSNVVRNRDGGGMAIGHGNENSGYHAMTIGRSMSNDIEKSIVFGVHEWPSNVNGTTPALIIRNYNAVEQRVGIWTTDPYNQLDVNGNASIGFSTGSHTAPANSLIVKEKIGIGTVSPQEALSVVGTGDNNQVIIWSTDQAAESANDVDLVVEKKALIGRYDAYNTTDLLHVDGGAIKSSGGADWSVPSDIRYKKDVSPFSDGLEKLRQINPVWFRYNGLMGLSDKGQEVGIIAQELQKIVPYCIAESEISQTIVTKEEKRYQVDAIDTTVIQVPDKTQKDERGQLKFKDTLILKPTKRWVIEPMEYKTGKAPILTYNSNALRYILINAVKEIDLKVQQMNTEHNNDITELNTVIDSLRLIISNQETRIARLESQNNINSNEIADIILEQNNPNPFSDKTVITYFVPNNVAGEPTMVISPYSRSEVMKTYKLQKGMPTQLTVTASDLGTGVYVYSVMIADNVVASKKFIIIK